jgi:hypothetical protein
MRLIAGLVLFGCCVASVLLGGVVFPAGFGFACYFGGNEFIKMAQKKGAKPSVRIVRGMIIAFLLSRHCRMFRSFHRSLNRTPVCMSAFL